MEPGQNCDPLFSLVSEDQAGVLPEFSAVTPRRKENRGDHVSLAAVIVVLGALAAVGAAVYSRMRDAAPALDVSVESIAVGKSGDEYRYVFELRNNEEAPLAGTITIELLNTEGARVDRKSYDYREKPIASGGSRRLFFDTKTNRAGYHGFKGAERFRCVIAPKKSLGRTTVEGSLSESLIDVEALRELEERLKKIKSDFKIKG